MPDHQPLDESRRVPRPAPGSPSSTPTPSSWPSPCCTMCPRPTAPRRSATYTRSSRQTVRNRLPAQQGERYEPMAVTPRPTVRNSSPSSQQTERYDPTGTLPERIVTAGQAASASCYDPSATLPAVPAWAAVTSVRNTRSQRDANRTAAGDDPPVTLRGGGGAGGGNLPRPTGSQDRRKARGAAGAAMPGCQARMSGSPQPRRLPRWSHSRLTACPGPSRRRVPVTRSWALAWGQALIFNRTRLEYALERRIQSTESFLD
jgi:hypothetical protein